MFFATLFAATILFATSTFADFQLIYPDNNVSQKPIIEFRARKGKPGHAFVAVGREYDNGLTAFYAIAGFYPKGNDLKSVLSGPGQINYKWVDTSSDVVFRVNITWEQEAKTIKTISEWDSKRYEFLWQNCTHLVRQVANDLGLRVPPIMLRPDHTVALLRSVNHPDAPIKGHSVPRFTPTLKPPRFEPEPSGSAPAKPATAKKEPRDDPRPTRAELDELKPPKEPPKKPEVHIDVEGEGMECDPCDED